MKSNRTITYSMSQFAGFYIPKKELRELDNIAKREDRSRSSVIRRLIRRALEQYRAEQ